MAKTIKKEFQKNELVIHHNYLIEAKYSVSLQEKRLILLMSSQIQKDDKDLQIYNFSVQELCNLFQIKNKNIYKEIDDVISKLFTRILTLKNLTEDSTTKISWLTYAKYWHGKGLIQLSFNQKLKPYLLEIQKKFTKISIGEIIGLRSVYAIRIFELLKQYENLGTRTFKIGELKSYCGISNNQYALYSNLKSKVLEISKREINSKTNYIVDYKEIKESRKVVEIEWTIKKKNLVAEDYQEPTRSLSKELRSEQALIESIVEYGYSKVIAKRLIQQHSEQVVRQALQAVDIQIKKGQVRNPKSMLQTAVQKKWHPEVFKKKVSE